MSEPDDDLELRLVRSLQRLDHELQSEWDASPAAVLVPLYQDSREWHLLFTRRTDDVDVHRGQVSFPGGRIEDGDESAAQAALRESKEEIGLQPGDVTILGELNPLMTVSQFVVTPVVGTFPWPYPLKANTSEVARCFGVPIKWLAEPSNLEVEYRQPMVPGPKIPVYYFKAYDDEVIWGVTARITVSFLEILGS
jgi:8-oxo-dGTP pyrophosphatase MutT (NUDIX family)